MATSPRSKRTAVLAVHGMGIQRPMDTVRGIVNAVWLETADRQFWTHPEPSNNDIDLLVIATNSLPNSDRTFDFHEFYWSHLMTGTRAVAVLLWLFELVGMGPLLKPGMRSLWGVSAIFLEFVILSSVYLVVLTIVRLAHVERDPWLIFLEPFFLLAIVAVITAILSILLGAFRLSGWLWTIAAVASVLIWILWLGEKWHTKLIIPIIPIIDIGTVRIATNLFLAPLLAGIVTFLLMGGWGLWALAAAYALSFCLYAIYYVSALLGQYTFVGGMTAGYLAWSLDNAWSHVAAFLFIGVYLALNRFFLASFIGDAARYFRSSPDNVAVRREIRRQVVNTLEMLHSCGKYDRIIIVAHSLGTVIAYDMLRAYFGRICKQIPCDPRWFGTDGQGADHHDRPSLDGRTIIAEIAAVCAASVRPSEDEEAPKPWLVTDFVTLGSPLTHAHYLMCHGQSEEELKQDFRRRVREREFPVRPPVPDVEHSLTFRDPNDGRLRFHHGAQFGLTRWTNLYFPMSQLLWGDAVGGPLAEADLFGDGVRDVKVSTRRNGKPALFTHTAYWNTSAGDGWQGPHIEALRAAINLEDRKAEAQ